METWEKLAKLLKELRQENSKQLKELSKEIAEVKESQRQILAMLQARRAQGSARRAAEEAKGDEERVRVDEEKAQPPGLEMYCSECFELRPIVEPKSVQLPDGSTATQGKCAVCGSTVFRMASMSGVLLTDATSARLRHQRD